jgi:hypothetical protein
MYEWMSKKSWLLHNDRERLKYLEKILSQSQFVHQFHFDYFQTEPWPVW